MSSIANKPRTETITLRAFVLEKIREIISRPGGVLTMGGTSPDIKETLEAWLLDPTVAQELPDKDSELYRQESQLTHYYDRLPADFLQRWLLSQPHRFDIFSKIIEAELGKPNTCRETIENLQEIITPTCVETYYPKFIELIDRGLTALALQDRRPTKHQSAVHAGLSQEVQAFATHCTRIYLQQKAKAHAHAQK